MRIRIGKIPLPYGRRMDVFQINDSPHGDNLEAVIVDPIRWWLLLGLLTMLYLVYRKMDEA